jgi:hypothetical protein
MGFTGIRIGTNVPGVDPDFIQTAGELSKDKFDGMRHIFLVFGGVMTKGRGKDEDAESWTRSDMCHHVRLVAKQLKGSGLGRSGDAMELGNEPDLAVDQNAKDLTQTFNEMFDIVREELPEVSILSPSISNLNKRGFRYLEKMLLSGLRDDCGLAFHRYPNGPSPHVSHDGFDDRNIEFQKLKNMSGGRELWCTETGFSQRWDRKDWTEENQREYIDTDMRFNRDRGLKHYTLYQVNDGPDEREIEDRWGIRHFDEAWNGDWKLLGQALPELIGRYA